MNTYHKYAPNVFCAKCTEEHQKGDTIRITTRHGNEHEAIVFNFLGAVNGFFYYSIVRADGFDRAEYYKNKAERVRGYASNAEKRAAQYRERSDKNRDFLVLGEPIKVGHHSEKRHRKAIDAAHKNMGRYFEESVKAERLEGKAEYYKQKATEITLAKPECLEYYADQLAQAKEVHKYYKDNPDKREHSYSLTYANNKVKELTKTLAIAQKLWGE